METVIRARAEELDQKFLDAIKTLFQGEEISITIKNFSNKQNYIYNQLQISQNPSNLITYSLTEFENFSKGLLESESS